MHHARGFVSKREMAILSRHVMCLPGLDAIKKRLAPRLIARSEDRSSLQPSPWLDRDFHLLTISLHEDCDSRAGLDVACGQVSVGDGVSPAAVKRQHPVPRFQARLRGGTA